MNKDFKLTTENFEDVKQFIFHRMKILAGWKAHQVERKKKAKEKRQDIENIDMEFLDIKTWRNLRQQVSGFFAYAWQLLEQPHIHFVSFLQSNTSALESLFSVQRMRRNDTASSFSSGITASMSKKTLDAGTRNSDTYNYDNDWTMPRKHEPSRQSIRDHLNSCSTKLDSWIVTISKKADELAAGNS